MNLSPIFLYAAGIPLIVAGWQLQIQTLFLVGLFPASIATVIVIIQTTAYYQSKPEDEFKSDSENVIKGSEIEVDGPMFNSE